MADNEIMADTIVPALEEIQNMKVTDLRKKLKALGLSVTGNKTELIERLQEACLSSKGDSFDSSQFNFDESQISELDSVDDSSTAIDDSALLDQDQLSLYVNPLEDDSKVLDSAESRSNSIIMPPKKRSLPKGASSHDGAVVEKKVTLNRTNVAHTDFDVKLATESKPEIIMSDKDPREEVRKPIDVKNMSFSQKLAMRAERFNVGETSTTRHNGSKFLNTLNTRNSKQSIISSAVTPELDVLKKRAERFGQSVSTVMKQIEQKEKLLKRKCKFGANLSIPATSSLDEQDKKRQRAERFGIS